MEIKGVNYRVWQDPADSVVSFEGVLQLATSLEYQPIQDLLSAVLQPGPTSITLDLRALSVLNDAGRNVLSKFAIEVHKKGAPLLVARGSRSVPWHGAFLPSLKKFHSNYEMILLD